MFIVYQILPAYSLSLSETVESEKYNKNALNRVKRSPFVGGGFGVGVRFDAPAFMNIPG